MKKNKVLKEMEERINALEREFNSILSSLTKEGSDKEKCLSYEEVIDIWLNGKRQ
jgi:hypothetical protein